MSEPIRVCVLTVSDRCSRGEAIDTSGPGLGEIMVTKLGAVVVERACVPDVQGQIVGQIGEWARERVQPDLILTTGGTGLASRDVTPEATRKLLEREHSGLIDLMQLRCYEKTPRTFLSRAVAGTIGRTLVINLPGSRRGSAECLEALLDILPHAIQTIRDEVKDHGPMVR